MNLDEKEFITFISQNLYKQFNAVDTNDRTQQYKSMTL